MLDLGFLPVPTKSDVQIFEGNATAAGVGWSTWSKPRGVSMCFLFAVGCGGGGGDAVAGAASTAAGGGGGGSGGQTTLLIPAILLPDTLYLSIAQSRPNRTSRLGRELRVTCLDLPKHHRQ